MTAKTYATRKEFEANRQRLKRRQTKLTHKPFAKIFVAKKKGCETNGCTSL